MLFCEVLSMHTNTLGMQRWGNLWGMAHAQSVLCRIQKLKKTFLENAFANF